MRDILSRYAPYLAGCRTAICQDLANAPLGRILSEYFEGGKMLRPLLVFVSASAVGGDPATVIPAAQALELLHGASLIHDDIVDGATERRGRSALHLQIGVGPAVVLGDYLILRAYTVFAQAQSPRVLEALQVLSQCAEECCRGQVEELSSKSGDPEENYFSIVRGKTASQFVAAATVGGILGDGRPEEIEALRVFALNLGIAFQIRDDELDLSNELVQSSSLPLIFLQKYGSKSALEKYSQITRNGGNQSELRELLREDGMFDRLRVVKEQHLNQALEAVKSLRNASEESAMTAMAQHAILRTQ
jgi:geranylgeranyl pyrophosphate synthase